MILRQPAAREVGGERPQFLPRFRLENVNPHGLVLPVLTIGCRRVAGAPTRSRSPPGRTNLCGGAHKPWLPSRRSGPDSNRRREVAPPRRGACGTERASTRSSVIKNAPSIALSCPQKRDPSCYQCGNGCGRGRHGKVKADLHRFCPISKVVCNSGTEVEEVWKVTRP